MADEIQGLRQNFRGGFRVQGIGNLGMQTEYLSGAQSIAVERSYLVFVDPGSPADSNITLSTGGEDGDLLFVVNRSAANTVTLLAASLVGSNNIALTAGLSTILIFNGTLWQHWINTAPA